MTTEAERRATHPSGKFWAIIGIAVVLCAIPLIFLSCVDRSSVYEALSAGGSLAGAVLLFGAVTLQRDELSLQRTELAASREVWKQQTIAAQEQAKHVAEQVKTIRDQIAVGEKQAQALDLQARLGWEGTVTALVTEAVKLRRENDAGAGTFNQFTGTAFGKAAERAEKLVDALTSRGSSEFVNSFIRNAWRDAVALPRLNEDGR